jgi:hypothetical protein
VIVADGGRMFLHLAAYLIGGWVAIGSYRTWSFALRLSDFNEKRTFAGQVPPLKDAHCGLHRNRAAARQQSAEA